MRSEQPLVQGNVAALHDRASPDGELVAAIVAEEHPGLCLAFHPANAERATVRAGRLTVPARDFDMGERPSLVVEDRVGDVRCHAPSYA